MKAQTPKHFFGGALLEGKRKHLRPLSTKNSLHIVMRSQWATGKDSFLVLRNRNAINKIITHFAKKFGVKVYSRALNSNHIHLLLRITNRRLYRAFIKAVSGKIASQVMSQQSFKFFSQSRQPRSFEPHANLTKGGDGVQTSGENGFLTGKKNHGFWEFRPFSRIVSWGRDFKNCVQYLKQNVLEAVGFAAYKPRKNYYSKWFKGEVKNPAP